MSKFLKTLLISTAALLLAGHLAAAKTMLDKVVLQWKPTTETDAFSKLDYKQLLKVKFKIDKLKDARKVDDLKLIGENTEDGKHLPVKSESDLGEFYQNGMTDTLKKLGVDMVTENADYTLEGKINHLFIAETNTYAGTLILDLTLKKGTKVVWNDIISVKNTRFGRSYKLDNYLEGYSDLAIEALLKLLDTQEFKDSFQTKKGKN